jgi:signal peptidase I
VSAAIEPPQRRRWLRHWVYIPTTLAAMVVVPLLLARLEWQPFSIPSASMEPTLEIGDYAFARHFHFIEPRRGDVVVFETHDTYFVKRIVGMPGDRLRLVAGAVHIDGVPLQRLPVADDQTPKGSQPRRQQQYVEIAPGGRAYRVFKREGFPERDNRPEIVVPPDRYYMLGENRDNSVDSRDAQIGLVARDDLVGRMEMIFWSAQPSRIGKTVDGQ